jgi:acyl carrier protein
VLDRTNPSVAERVNALIAPLLAKHGIVYPIGRDADLTESGLSSLDLVNLMLAVEGEFDLSIPDRDMTPSNFRTRAHIEALVAGLLQAA